MATRKNLRRRKNFRLKGKSTRGGTKLTKRTKLTAQNSVNYAEQIKRMDVITRESIIRQNRIYKEVVNGLLRIGKITPDYSDQLKTDIDSSSNYKKQKSFDQIREIIKNLNIEELNTLNIFNDDVIRLFRFTYNKHKRENPIDAEEMNKKLEFLIEAESD